MSDAQTLLRLQQCDTEVLRLNKQIEELPQAAQIIECRSKRKGLKAKLDQAIELSDEVDKKFAAFQLEEERLIKKLNDLQQTLDTTHDYRVTQSVTRDMEGLVKRQKTLVEESDALLERQIKIDKLNGQIGQMLHDLDHKEEELTKQFKEQGGAIKVKIGKLLEERTGLLSQLDCAIADKYEKLRAEKGGIGATYLDGHTCSGCRSEILEGNLRRLLAGPEIGECPNCHRLIVVTRPEEQ